jgi:DNA repair protein RadD
MKKYIENDARCMIENGKFVLILVDQISHGKELSESLNIPFISGEDPDSYKYIGEFNAHKIKAIVATDSVFGEGVDSRPVEVIILATFVASKVTVIQSIGRGLRKTPEKDKCLIIDYIPEGSEILRRHALQRISYYKEITNNIKIKSLN